MLLIACSKQFKVCFYLLLKKNYSIFYLSAQIKVAIILFAPIVITPKVSTGPGRLKNFFTPKVSPQTLGGNSQGFNLPQGL
jgi:hypothetical protein